MDEVASTKAEANHHIQRLREARGIKGNNNDVSDDVLVSSLNAALNLLSDQLYTTPTHFLLELIQNADDNSYVSGAAALHLSLYKKAGKRIFRSDCNETGFTFNQLDALTRIGKSTKAVADGRKGYIGEKGIGFKSVFKVADVVYVASGYYEFKFNRLNTIGMMLPILCSFPSDDRVNGHTQFLLELNRKSDYQQIREDLEGIRPEILLFLRKLKQLHVSINGEHVAYKLRTKNWDGGFDGETVDISETAGQETRKTKYMIERLTVEDLPPDPRREEVDASEVVVAFAVKNRTTPIVRPQPIFAFLPIQDCGFPFLIHADFLLTASRESLEYHCPWNLALRKGIRDAVVEAIEHRFVNLDEEEDDEGLCYSWPMYLKRQPTGQAFWDLLHRSILEALRSRNILRSQDSGAASGLHKPEEVRYVPEAYRFEGEALFDLPSITKKHLSFVYDNVHNDLLSIGVSPLSRRSLCNEFCQWVGEAGVAGLKKKPGKWHSRVAQIFCSDEEWVKQKLKRLPIIPLLHGSWVTATEHHLYLPSPDREELVPSGVNISIIARDAVRDPYRRKFYEYLGIKEYNPRQVCELIVELHLSLAAAWTGRSNDNLINDAVYLFMHRKELASTKPPDIFFAVHKGGQIVPQRSARIYLVDPKSKHGVIKKYKDAPRNPFAVLSNRYEEELQGGERKLPRDFRKWLLQSSTVFATTPDLVRNSSLTPEWNFLRDQNVLDLLYVIRDQLSTAMFTPPKLMEAVPRLKVPCLDGQHRRLGGLAVPTRDLKRRCPHLHFADLPEPTSHNWRFLSQFGVIVELGTTAILGELQALRQIHVRDLDPSAIKALYETLDSYARDNKWEIQRAFDSRPLVFVPLPEPRWLSHRSCVWTAPKLLTRVSKLMTYYRNCECLFHSVLGVKAAGIRHVVDEFCEPVSKTDADTTIEQRFEAMLSLLAKFHEKSSLTKAQISRIRSAPVIPIQAKGFALGGSLSGTEMRSFCDKDWYIPDRVTFEAALRGKVNMLVLRVQAAMRLKGLLEDLGCREKFLSEAVTRSVRPHGVAVPDPHEEKELHGRLRYVSRVLKGSVSDEVLNVSSIRVWSVPSITVTMSVADVEVTVDDELVTVKESTDTTDIYFREGIRQKSTQAEAMHELVNYFKETMEFDEKFESLVNLLMIAPMGRLPGILDKHDIPLPEGPHPHGNESGADSSEGTFHSGDHDSETVAEEDETNSEGPAGSCDSSGDDVSVIAGSPITRAGALFLPSGRGTNSDREAKRRHRSSGGTYNTAARGDDDDSIPLQERISSHQSRSKSIIQSASEFRLSEAEAAAPIQRHAESRSTSRAAPQGFSLPIRPRTFSVAAGESESSSAFGFGFGISATRVFSRLFYPTSRREPTDQTHTSRSRAQVEDTSQIRARGIGFLGELFVFEMFARQIDDWTFECWTSRMRSEAGHPRFQGLERDFSDFTYVDSSGRMRAALRDVGIEPNAAWSDATKFHLEVKSTLGPCAEAMYVSQNQVDKMRQFDRSANDAYILLRVFDLEVERKPGVKFFCNPWSLYMEGVLKFRSDEGYKVYQ